MASCEKGKKSSPYLSQSTKTDGHDLRVQQRGIVLVVGYPAAAQDDAVQCFTVWEDWVMRW